MNSGITCCGEEELPPRGVEERVGDEQVGEERGVSVGGAGEGGPARGDGRRGVGEDEVVDVGVPHLEVRVLPLPERQHRRPHRGRRQHHPRERHGGGGHLAAGRPLRSPPEKRREEKIRGGRDNWVITAGIRIRRPRSSPRASRGSVGPTCQVATWGKRGEEEEDSIGFPFLLPRPRAWRRRRRARFRPWRRRPSRRLSATRMPTPPASASSAPRETPARPAPFRLGKRKIMA